MVSSLRRRLLAVTLSVFSISWVAVGTSAFLDSRRETGELLDAELEQVAKIVMTMSQHELEEELLAQNTDQDNTLALYDRVLTGSRFHAKLAFQVWINGDILALRSNNAPTTRLSPKSNGIDDVVVDAQHWRVFSLTEERTLISVHVGEHVSVRQELMTDAALRTILPLAMIAPLIGALTWWGVGRALDPLRRVAEMVAGRNPRDLSPIDAARVPEESRFIVEALNRLFGRLRDAFDVTRRFTADAAHELRTPLAGIAAQADVALLARDEDVRTSALAAIKTSTKNMSRLIQQLMTIARWDANVANFERSPLLLNHVVSGVVHELQHAATTNDIRLMYEVVSEPLFFGDETMVQLITRNLVDNAIRYTPRGGTVRVEVDSTPHHAVLRVRDTGSGLTAEQRKRIFQRFYRGGRHDTTGSGLGLSIVQRCVELHGGTIDLDSPESGGLSVIVSLPKRTASDALDAGMTKSDIP